MPLKLDKISVLVVEDIAPMRKLIVGVLEALEIGKIMTADHGGSGFRTFKNFNPDVIITDWEMEPISGFEMIQKIRSDPSSPNKTVPIILITGYSSKSRVVQARDIGVTEFLTKPFTGHDLTKRIEHIINKPRDFVETSSFFGPDRRRRKIDDYSGPSKRESDEGQKPVSSKDIPWDIIIN
ncbi:MAG TPA: response regulator [Alphaproteobacteria bacterium]|nr:response regulator [Alphaproteobacteria bacterium]HNS44534.1 response regulator [Alphaproteobacteria bacterium]